MITKTIKINVDSEEANKDLEKFDDTIKETDESTEGLTGSLDAMTGGAVAGFSKMAGGIRKVVLGFKTLKGAIAATGIGLLILAIGSLATAFTASEEGQNKFAKIMAQIGVVTGNVIDILANLGESLLAAGKALVKLAKGDIKGASEAWGEFKDNIKETTEGVKNFGEETRRELKSVAELSDNLAKADKLSRDLLIERAEAERDIAILRDKVARRDLYNAEERKAALIEAGEISDKIIDKEIYAQKLRYDAIVLNNSLSKSTKEDLEEEAQAQAELIRLETSRFARRKELGSELSAINEAEKAAAEALAAAEAKAAEDEIAAIEAIIDKELELEQAKEDELLKQITDIEEKKREQAQITADENIRIKQSEEYAKQQLVNATSMLIQGLAKEGSALAKSAALAQVAYNTYVGIMGVFNNPVPTPFLVKLANAATVGAMGILNTKNILADKQPSGSSSSSGSARQAPSFNLVKGTGTNTIAESVNAQNLTPIKTYVVSSDVSTSQEFDRKIIEGASL